MQRETVRRTTYCSQCSEQTFVCELYGVVVDGAGPVLSPEDVHRIDVLCCERCGKRFAECSVCGGVCDAGVRNGVYGDPAHANCQP